MTNSEINEAALFVVEQGGRDYRAIDLETLEKIIKKHDEYGTLIVVRDNLTNKIIALVRWNFEGGYAIVNVLDAVIHKNFRSLSTIKQLVALGLNRYPQTGWLIYDRQGTRKDGNKRKSHMRFINIREFMRRRKHVEKMAEVSI